MWGLGGASSTLLPSGRTAGLVVLTMLSTHEISASIEDWHLNCLELSPHQLHLEAAVNMRAATMLPLKVESVAPRTTVYKSSMNFMMHWLVGNGSVLLDSFVAS